MLAQIGVFDGDEPQDLTALRLGHVGAHGFLLQFLEGLDVHELLEFLHLVQLDANRLLLVLVLGDEDVSINALSLQQLLVTCL